MGRFARTLRPALVAVATATLLCGAANAAPQPSARDIDLLDALTWGVTESSATELARLGADRWLDAQLAERPAPLPPAVADRIANLSALQRPLAESVREAVGRQQALAAITDPEEKKLAQQATQRELNDAARQAATRSILLALYGPDQIRQRLVWFWFNRFNVHQGKANLRLMVGDYEERAIRPHALGRFRDLVGATLRHPAMLRYLDNAQNAAGRLNENYARELMELHTLGVGAGYTQRDVEELARILTGFGIDLRAEEPRLRPELRPLMVRDGLFVFNPARHDFGDKQFLGHVIRGRGAAEIDEALDILCRHPATARHVARALATYFVGDAPPDALVKRMADAFVRSDGAIADVMRAMVASPEFAASLGTRYKDPVRFVLSAVRFAYDDKPILNALPIITWLNRLGEGLFNHPTPDGHPLSSAAWKGSGQLVTRFEIARQIGSGPAGLFRGEDPAAPDRPAFPVLQNALYFAVLRGRLSAPVRAALDQAVSPQEWNMLFLSSPDFMQ